MAPIVLKVIVPKDGITKAVQVITDLEWVHRFDVRVLSCVISASYQVINVMIFRSVIHQ